MLTVPSLSRNQGPTVLKANLAVITRNVPSPSTRPSNEALLGRVRVLIDTRPSMN